MQPDATIAVATCYFSTNYYYYAPLRVRGGALIQTVCMWSLDGLYVTNVSQSLFPFPGIFFGGGIFPQTYNFFSKRLANLF